MDARVFSLGANDELAQSIAEKLGVSLGRLVCKTFSDGEERVQFLDNLRGKSVYLIQPTQPPAEHWMRLFLALDVARRRER